MVIKNLTLEQRVEIDEELMHFYFKNGVDLNNTVGAPIPLRIALKAVRYAVDEIPEDISNEELIKLFAKVQEKAHLSEIEKKS